MREKTCDLLAKILATLFVFIIFASVLGLVDFIDSEKHKEPHKVHCKTCRLVAKAFERQIAQ